MNKGRLYCQVAKQKIPIKAQKIQEYRPLTIVIRQPGSLKFRTEASFGF